MKVLERANEVGAYHLLIFMVTGRQQDGPNSLSQESDAQTKVNVV